MTDHIDHRAEAEILLADADEWASQAGELSPRASERACLDRAQVHALLAIHDTLTAADRYAANEAKQREAGAGCPTLVECLRTLEATRPGTDDRPLDAAYREGLHTAYDHLRSLLVEHGVPVSPRVDEPEMSEAAEWRSRGGSDPLDESDHRDRIVAAIVAATNAANEAQVRQLLGMGGGRRGAAAYYFDRRQGPLAFAPEAAQEAKPDPLDEDDWRDRVDRDGDRWVRNPVGRWHTRILRDCRALECEWTLAHLSERYGPLAFAPDTDGTPSVTAPVADDPADDAVDGKEGERRYLNAQTVLCPECGHDIDRHAYDDDRAVDLCGECPDTERCPTPLPSQVARALMEQAANIERTRLTSQLRLTTSSVQDGGDLAELDALADAWEAGIDG